MANTSIQYIRLEDGAEVNQLMVDIGGGLYAAAVTPVDGTGAGVGTFTKQVAVVTDDTPDYSVLDVIGGIIEFPTVNSSTGRPVEIMSLVGVDKTGLRPAFTLMLFNATPAGGTYSDNGALILHANDYAKYVGSIQVVAGDWHVPVSGSGFFAKAGILLPASVAGTSLWGLIIADSTWNAATVADLVLTLGGNQK